jgi:hypothetical protein
MVKGVERERSKMGEEVVILTVIDGDVDTLEKEAGLWVVWSEK